MLKRKKPETQLQADVRHILMCTLGAFIIAFNLNTFVNTGGVFPGGFAGVALLIIRGLAKYAGIHLSYSIIYIPINLIPVWIGWKYIGKRFTLFSLYVIVLSSLLTDFMPKITVTYDVFLIALFGGIVNGTVISICLYANACTGGTDFISMYFSAQKGVDAWNYIFAGNVVVLTLAGLMFGWDKPLYSIVYQFCTTQVIHTFFRRYNSQTLMIISEKSEEIYEVIRLLTHHDGTLFKGIGMYQKKERRMILSVVSSDEVSRLLARIQEIDPNAFINIWKTEQLVGNFHRRDID